MFGRLEQDVGVHLKVSWLLLEGFLEKDQNIESSCA